MKQKGMMAMFGIYHTMEYYTHKRRNLELSLTARPNLGVFCLNRELLQGPDLTNTLFGVLTTFQQDKVALMADIEGMFSQV